VIGQPPPFALATPTFPFRALASHAGRAALGGDREVLLACFAIARLAAGMLPPYMLAPGDAATRIASTRQWLASLALSAAARTAAAGAVEAISRGNRKTVAHAISRLCEAASGQLDQPSIMELRGLIDELASG
jgi:hypothetical protein